MNHKHQKLLDQMAELMAKDGVGTQEYIHLLIHEAVDLGLLTAPDPDQAIAHLTRCLLSSIFALESKKECEHEEE